jgi:hypothetical protein
MSHSEGAPRRAAGHSITPLSQFLKPSPTTTITHGHSVDRVQQDSSHEWEAGADEHGTDLRRRQDVRTAALSVAVARSCSEVERGAGGCVDRDMMQSVDIKIPERSITMQITDVWEYIPSLGI